MSWAKLESIRGIVDAVQALMSRPPYQADCPASVFDISKHWSRSETLQGKQLITSVRVQKGNRWGADSARRKLPKKPCTTHTVIIEHGLRSKPVMCNSHPYERHRSCKATTAKALETLLQPAKLE